MLFVYCRDWLRLSRASRCRRWCRSALWKVSHGSPCGAAAAKSDSGIGVLQVDFAQFVLIHQLGQPTKLAKIEKVPQLEVVPDMAKSPRADELHAAGHALRTTTKLRRPAWLA